MDIFPQFLPVTSDYNSNFESSIVVQNENEEMQHPPELVNAPQRDIHIVEEQTVALPVAGHADLKLRIIKKLGSGAYGCVYKGILYGP